MENEEQRKQQQKLMDIRHQITVLQDELRRAEEAKKSGGTFLSSLQKNVKVKDQQRHSVRCCI